MKSTITLYTFVGLTIALLSFASFINDSANVAQANVVSTRVTAYALAKIGVIFCLRFSIFPRRFSKSYVYAWTSV